MFSRNYVLALPFAAVMAGGAAHAATYKVQPGEDTSKDVFVYAFTIPGTLGIPTAPNETNFDTESIPSTSVAPFGSFLGAAETEPFRTDPTDPNEPLRVHTTRSLLQFDLSTINAAANLVANAMITLAAVPGLPPFDNATPGNPVQLALRPVLEDWDEQTVTWDTRPMVGDVFATFTLTGVPTMVDFDITELLKGWLDEPSTNFGVEISQIGLAPVPQGPDMKDRFAAALFTSSAFDDPSLRPALTVSTVPLPAGFVLLLGGLGVLGGLRGKRRTQA